MSLPYFLSRLAGQLAAGAASDFIDGFSNKKHKGQSSKDPAYDPSQSRPNPEERSNKDQSIFDQLSKMSPSTKESLSGGGFANAALASAVGNMLANFLRPPELPSAMSTVETYAFRDVASVPQKMQATFERFLGNSVTAVNPLAGPGNNISAMADNMKLFIEFPAIVERWGQELSKSQEHLTKYNAQLAIAYTISERRQIMRDIQTSDRIAGSASAREDAIADLSDRLQGFRDAITNMTNNLTTKLSRVAEYHVAAFQGFTSSETFKGISQGVATLNPVLAAFVAWATGNNNQVNQGPAIGQQFAESILNDLKQQQAPLVKPAQKPGGGP